MASFEQAFKNKLILNKRLAKGTQKTAEGVVGQVFGYAPKLYFIFIYLFFFFSKVNLPACKGVSASGHLLSDGDGPLKTQLYPFVAQFS